MVRKTLKPIIAFSLIAAFAVFSVLCCCTTSALMAHFHKTAVCSHCHEKNSQDHSSDHSGSCKHQFSNAEFIHGPVISLHLVSGNSFPSSVFLNDHHIAITHLFLSAHPPGGPPLGASLTPLYLRTFNLRI